MSTVESRSSTSENAVTRKFNFAEFPFYVLGCIARSVAKRRDVEKVGG
jgi:hypothetical protein